MEMNKDTKIGRLVDVARVQNDMATMLEEMVSDLAAVPRLDRVNLNRTFDAVQLSLRALRCVLAQEIGRAQIGDEVIDEPYPGKLTLPEEEKIGGIQTSMHERATDSKPWKPTHR